VSYLKSSNKALLPIRSEHTYNIHDFFIGKCNIEAYSLITIPPEQWPLSRLLIIGEKGSGKSHLATIWQTKYKGVKWHYDSLMFIDCMLQTPSYDKISKENNDIINSKYQIVENINSMKGKEYEMWLCGVLNYSLQNKTFLLMTASNKPQFNLPDLVSRINATYSVKIGAPDEEMISTVVRKYIYDKQLKVAENAISYIINHIVKHAQSFNYIHKVMEELERAIYNIRHKSKQLSLNRTRQIIEEQEVR
jgi:chromosomal replication initiation ATPase DnaA